MSDYIKYMYREYLEGRTRIKKVNDNGNTGNAISDRVSCPAMIVKIFEDLRYMLSSKFCSQHRNAPIAVKGK